MDALWILVAISVLVSIAPGSAREESEWNYPYYNLDDYLGYLASETDRKEYVNSRDGTYHFKYDTGREQQPSFRGETRDRYGTVRGYYGYIDPDGVLRMTEYVADRLGYRTKMTLRYLVVNA